MTQRVSERIKFPSVRIVKASAGSGKTYQLTKTFVEYILSDSIPNNELKNILAITFSNNAAIEIKERILKWLKDIYFNRENVRESFSGLFSSEQELAERAASLINKILSNYSDFQVRTIDSFMAKIFKAESLNLGYPGDFEILMNPRNFRRKALRSFLSRFSEGSIKAEQITALVDLIEENQKTESFIWNPADRILREVERIERELFKNREDLFYDLDRKVRENLNNLDLAKARLKEQARRFIDTVRDRGLKFRNRSKIESILEEVLKDSFTSVLDGTFNECPVLKPDLEVNQAWMSLKKAAAEYIVEYYRAYLIPYLLFLNSFREFLSAVKLKEQKVFIDDINRMIAEKIAQFSIPEIYFKLGERIFHFLIDEFQDTSPIQWYNLKVLIEDSLAKGGSLLIVGDTKQAIYGFRGADFTIMTGLLLESNNPSEFTSVKQYEIDALDRNFRSGQVIVEFVRDFFQEKLREYLLSLRDTDRKKFQRLVLDDSQEPAALYFSGLIECEQQVKENLRGIGFVKIEKIPYHDENEEEAKREALITTIEKLKDFHNFSYDEIAILAFENSTLKQISTWLNERGISFLSLSSLDVRNRKIIAEIIHLLRFLDSPVDDFSFAMFLLGDVAAKEFGSQVQDWREKVEQFLFSQGRGSVQSNLNEPYYKAFRESFPSLWDRYFSKLFKNVGFLPLYELVSEILQSFRLFENFSHEEAALIKLSEISSKFEGEVGEFIEFFETSGDEDEAFWDISKPKTGEALTLMTIHKAKGLEFPAVILFADMNSVRLDDYMFYQDNLIRTPREGCLENEFLLELRKVRNSNYNRVFAEELNKLYVALTRAKEALYILIPCKEDTTKDSKECAKANYALKALLSMNQTYGALTREATKKQSDETICNLLELDHRGNRSDSVDYCDPNWQFIDFYEIRKGEALHQILSKITTDASLGEKDIDSVLFEMKIAYLKSQILEEVERVLKNAQLKEYFVQVEGRQIFTEQELVDSKGRLFRVDRLIIDSDRVTVLEFKFGKSADRKGAIEQVQGYVEILKQIFAEKVIEGVVYFSHNEEIIKI